MCVNFQYVVRANHNMHQICNACLKIAPVACGLYWLRFRADRHDGSYSCITRMHALMKPGMHVHFRIRLCPGAAKSGARVCNYLPNRWALAFARMQTPRSAVDTVDWKVGKSLVKTWCVNVNVNLCFTWQPKLTQHRWNRIKIHIYACSQPQWLQAQHMWFEDQTFQYPTYLLN